MAPGTEKADGVEDQRGGSMFITQRAQVAGTGADGRPVKKGQKMSKAVKLPKIDAARGVDPVTQSSQSTELVLANKEMAEVQHKLDRKKEEYDERMAKCKEKEEILSMKVEKLKAEEEKFKLFLKENDNKRQRALKRAQDEQNIRLQKEKEIQQLSRQLLETNASVVSARSDLDNGLVYQTYLEAVIKAAPEDFSEIEDIIKRYKTLSATNEDLQMLVQTNMGDTESSRLELSKLAKLLQNEALVKSSEIAELQEKLERVKLQTVLEEANKAHRQDDAKDAIRELGEAKMATFNLFNRCRATHMADSRPRHETDKPMVALDYIQERFRDLALIVKDGYDRGLVGKIKIREAAVDRQAVKSSAAGTIGAAKAGTAAKQSKGVAGSSLNASMTGSQSGLGAGATQAPAQPPLH